MAKLSLTQSGAFVWEGSEEEARLRHEYLRNLTKTMMSADGALKYYTADDRGRPVYNPWAVLPLADDADPETRAHLAPVIAEYEASFALEGPDDVAPMPEGEELLPFQRAGVAYALKRENAIIADPMGLGKSVQALAVANAIEARRILVICPASTLIQWRGYCERWLLPIKGINGVHVVLKNSTHPSARVNIVSYDRAKQAVYKQLVGMEYDLLILDEAHYLKNSMTQRARAIFGARKMPGIVTRAKRVLALTGTLLPNRPRECYALVRALDHEAIGWMSFDSFQARYNPVYMGVSKSGNRFVAENAYHLPELNARLRVFLMVRRDKDKAAPQLPPKRYTVVSVGNKETDEIVSAEKLLDIDIERLGELSFESYSHVAALRRQMGVAMVPLVVEYISNILDTEPDPIVLYAYHLEVIDLLAEKLRSYNPVVVTGATPPRARAEAANRFARDPSVRLFIGQVRAAGTGIDGLQTRASTVVFAEPSWVPGENEQCVDRLHRFGQTSRVHAVFLVAPESWNERIIKRVVEKLRVAHLALDQQLIGG